MLVSKMLKNILVLGSGLLVLNACSLEKPKSPPTASEQNATFFIERQEARFTTTKNHAVFSIPVQKTLSLKVCLKDTQYSKPIQNQAFYVQLENPLKIISDASGCMVWDEVLDYNHLASAQYLTLKRRIYAEAYHRGGRDAEWIINPWENIAQSALDVHKPVKILAADQWAKALSSNDSGRPVWVDDLKVTVERSLGPGSTSLKFQIRAEPKLNLTNATGDNVVLPLNQGQFKAVVYLINMYEDKGETRSIIKSKSAEIDIASLNNGIAFIESKLELKDFHTPGQAALGLELLPVQGPAGLTSFSGVFILTDIDNVFGNFFARLRAHANLEAIKKDAAPETQLQSSAVTVQPLSFDHKQWTGNDPLQRERVIEIQACIAYGLDRKPIPGYKLNIVTTSGQSIETEKSNLSGCVKWNESVAFNFLSKESYQERQIQISNSELGLKESIAVSINPWSEAANFAYDLRANKPPALVSGADKGTEFVPENYAFSKEQTYNYDIDKNLNLILIKKGNLALNNVMIVKKSISSSSGRQTLPIPVGDYKVKYALVDGTLTTFKDPTQFIGKVYHYEETVGHAYAPGIINLKVAFKIHNIKAIGQTSQLLVQIEPTRKQETVGESLFAASILLSSNSESKNLSPIASFAPGIMDLLRKQLAFDQAEADRLNKILASKERFAADQNLQLIHLDQEASIAPLLSKLGNPLSKKSPHNVEQGRSLSQVYLQSWLDSGKMHEALAQRMCMMWFYDQLYGSIQAFTKQDVGLVRDCILSIRESPKQFFDIEFRLLVKNPRLGPTSMIQTSRQDLLINQIYQVQKAYVYNVTKSLSWDASVGIIPLSPIKEVLSTVPVLNMLSTSTGIRYQVSQNKINADTYSNNIAATQSLALTLNKVQLPVIFDSYEKCAVIRLNPNIVSNPAFQAAMNPQLSTEEWARRLTSGYMICQGHDIPATAPALEPYFSFNQKPSDDQIIDAYSDNGRPYFASIRGTQDYLKFLSFIHQGMEMPKDHLAEYQSYYMLKEVNADVFKRGLPAYPGHLIRDR